MDNPLNQPKKPFFWDLFLKRPDAAPEDFPWEDVTPANSVATQEEADRGFQQLQARINAHPAFGAERRHPNRWVLTRVVAAVAVFLLLGAGGFWFIREGTAFQTYTTGFGEFREMQLPDGSQVKLHANSRLRLRRSWGGGEMREVWLEGQAYFVVTKKKAPDIGPVKFVVHAGDMEVEVLGTRFDVRNQEGDRRVVLEEGKVAVSLVGGSDTGRQVLHLSPGHLVALDPQKQELVAEQVETAPYLAWTQSHIVLINRTLREVAGLIEEAYGVEVTIQSEQVANLRLSGTIPMDELGKLLDALEVAADISITRNQYRIEIAR